MITDRKKKNIFKMKENGLTTKTICNKYGVSQQRVLQILNNRKIIGKQQRRRIYKRDKNTCQWEQICNGYTKREDLNIHHIDLDPSNGEDNNLITLCKYCHRHFHKSIRDHKPCLICGDSSESNTHYINGKRVCDKCYKTYLKKNKDKWSIKYDKCVECGTTDKKHHSNGLCVICYGRKRFKDPVYREKHKQCVKNWGKNNPEKLKRINKETQKKWYSENKEKVSQYSKIWKKNNPEKLKQQQQKYQGTEKYKINNLRNVRKWRLNNKDKVREYARRQREKIKLAKVTKKL